MAHPGSTQQELDQGVTQPKQDRYPESLKVGLEDPALDLNELDLRELSKKIYVDENGYEMAVSLVAQQLGMEKELAKSNGASIFDLLCIWCKKEKTTVGMLISTFKNMGRSDCSEFVDKVARYKFIMLYPFLHMTPVDGQARTVEIPAVQVPAKLSLREFVRGSIALEQNIINFFGGTISEYTIKLKRLDQLKWDSRSGDYGGHRIDLHLHQNGNISPNEPLFAYTDDMSSIPVQSDSTYESYIEIEDQYTRLRTSDDSGGGQDNLSQASADSFVFCGEDSAFIRDVPPIPSRSRNQSLMDEHSARIDLISEAFAYSEEVRLTQINQEEQEIISLPGFHQYWGVPPTELREKAMADIKQYYYKKHKKNGCHLIRRSRSQSDQQPFTLTFGHRDILHHISILHTDGKYALQEQPDLLFVSVAELIKYYKEHDIKPNIRLSDPVLDRDI